MEIQDLSDLQLADVLAQLYFDRDNLPKKISMILQELQRRKKIASPVYTAPVTLIQGRPEIIAVQWGIEDTPFTLPGAKKESNALKAQKTEFMKNYKKKLIAQKN